ncbi:hypothetical protein VKT23_020788 [Stygiomarasmius scandens]|uniref:Uncharacterized protein n=1 Tax=Marasmiellus scandens TaxID=2682957 RepID=A0ABR1JAA3_9AGAR
MDIFSGRHGKIHRMETGEAVSKGRRIQDEEKKKNASQASASPLNLHPRPPISTRSWHPQRRTMIGTRYPTFIVGLTTTGRVLLPGLSSSARKKSKLEWRHSHLYYS